MMEIFPRRRWLRRLAVGAVTVGAVVPVLCGWAFLSLDRSSIARAMLWMGADVDDQHRFSARVIRAGDAVSSLPAAPEIFVPEVPAGERGPFDRFLRDSDIADRLAKEADR